MCAVLNVKRGESHGLDPSTRFWSMVERGGGAGLVQAIFVVCGEWVNPDMVIAWNFYLRTSLLYRQRYIVVFLLANYCKSFGIKASAKCPECKYAQGSGLRGVWGLRV